MCSVSQVDASSAPLPFDASPLTEPVDRAAVRAYVRSRGGFWTGKNVFGIVIAVVVLIMFAFIMVPMFFAVVSSLTRTGGTAFPLIMMVLFIGFAVVIVAAGIFTLGGAGTRSYRLDQFARRNGMVHVPRVDDPALPGMIFSLGSDRYAGDVVRGDQPRFVEFANYRYTTGSGKSRTTHKWGYVAIKLDVPLPNIVLDATSNNGLFGASNLPAGFERDQRLGLEGDFDKHFTLYCPRGYERDALYLFTPDIMARFIDHAAALDVEIVDDWLFLYAKRDLSTLDPATWAWMFATVRALLTKFAQWARWRDDRLAASAAAVTTTSGADASVPGAPAASTLPFAAPAGLLTPPPIGVAPEGRRLKRRFPVLGLVIAIGFVVFWAWSLVNR